MASPVAPQKIDRKITYALIAAAAYVILSYPVTYKFTNTIASSAGLSTSNSAGCPTLTGLFAHGSVVGGIVYFLLAQNYIIPMVKAPTPPMI